LAIRHALGEAGIQFIDEEQWGPRRPTPARTARQVKDEGFSHSIARPRQSET
jgi:hypothetical protein